jgi:hypothetical protein
LSTETKEIPECIPDNALLQNPVLGLFGQSQNGPEQSSAYPVNDMGDI